MLLDYLRETFFSSLICLESGEPPRPPITTVTAKMFTCYNPKFSKPKWARNMGKNKRVNLTHAEVWDDSALVQSWDDAVEEYQVSR